MVEQLYDIYCSFLWRATTHNSQPPAGKTISTRHTMTTSPQEDVPAAVDGAWHTTLLCQFLVCGVRWERNPRGRVSAWKLFVCEALSDPRNGPFHRLAEVAKPLIRSQHQAVFAHGDAVDLLVKVLDALQQVVEDLVRHPVRHAQSLG